MNYRLIKSKAVFEMFLVISLIFIISMSLNSNSVVAAEDKGCCLKSGEQQCQYITKQECDSSEWYPGTCDLMAQCKPGCCDLTSTSDGVCLSHKGANECRDLSGTIIGSESCENYDQCSLGCCVIGTQGFLTTEKGCGSKLSELGYDIDMFFEPGVSEVECMNKARAEVQGCCINDGMCSQTSSEQCNGQFIFGLCKDVPNKCDNCKGVVQKRCVEGKTEVYNVDSCREILSVADGCSLIDGKICDDSDGTGKCIDVNCKETWDNPKVDYDGVARKYSESWCEFDSNSGPGIDLPGTRQYKHYCENGKEKVIECEDMRTRVCVDSEIDGFRNANCVENKANECLDCGSDNACCEDIGFGPGLCLWFGESDDGFCGPYNTQGNYFWDSESETNDKCDLADNTFTTYWSGTGHYDCDSGCEVYTNKFASNVNQFCNIYGDCGAKYDVTGDFGADGFSRSCEVSNRGELSLLSDPGDIFDASDHPEAEMSKWDVSASDNGGEACLDNCASGSAGDKCREYCDETGDDCDGDADECAGALIHQCHDSIDEFVRSNYYPKFEDYYKNYKDAMYFGSHSISDPEFAEIAKIVYAIVGGVGVGAIVLFGGAMWTAVGTVWAGGAAAGPWGIVIAAIITVLIILTALILYLLTDDVTRDVTVDCNAWEPVAGSDKCGLCDTASDKLDLTADGLHDCTDYMCRSLGKNCEPVETEGVKKCIDACEINGVRDVMAPFIVPADYSITCANGQQCEIVANKNGFEIKNAIQPFTDVNLSFKTCKDQNCREEEFATCKFDKEMKNEFSGLTLQFDQADNAFKHTKTLLKNVDVKPGESYNYYMICQDRCGNPADEALTGFYQIKFSVADGPDLMAPSLIGIEPVSGGYVAYETNETEVKLTIDESIDETINGVRDTSKAGGCRWDTQDVPYLQMSYNMSCPQMQGVGNYQYCKTQLNVTNVAANQYYFRCRDNKGNMNGNSLGGVYTLVKTDPLLISSVQCETPLGTACDDLYYPTFTLNVQTAGGIGIASCGATESDENRQDFMFTETGTGHSHKTQIGPRSTSPNGEKYNYNIVCNDEAGNVVSQVITLNLISDEVAPIIEKYYRDGSLFVIETNEWAQCYFNGENKFDSSDGFKHLTNADQELYVISCKDRFENKVQTINVHLI